MTSQHGFVLFIVLLFVFVLTLVSVNGTNAVILENKMQNHAKEYALVFARAESGLQQAVLFIEGIQLSLPDSSIALHVSTNVVATDKCGNRMIDIQSVAHGVSTDVVLNSRQFFAKVPREQGCPLIPAHQVVWWKVV